MSAVKEAPGRRKYKLMAGIHYEINPSYENELDADGKKTNRHHPDRMIKYTYGDVIESDRDLVAQYANKFERVVEYAPPAVVVSEERKQAVGLLMDKGWTEEDRKFLEEMPQTQFNRVQAIANMRSTVVSEKKRSSPLGEDVTDQFQRAYDEGFAVFRNAAGKHQITRGNVNKPLNLKPLEQGEVDKFVENFLKEK